MLRLLVSKRHSYLTYPEQANVTGDLITTVCGNTE